jgi:putative spermidine/putrescine transport system substrate-binding protein
MAGHGISRRQFNKLIGAGLVGATLGPLVPNPGEAASKEIVVCSWGGAYQKALRKAFFDPFEKEMGIKVTDTSSPQVAKVKAQVDAKNVEWDIIDCGTRWYNVLVEQKLVEPLNLGKINTADLIPEAVLSHGIATTMSTMVLAFNKEKFPDKRPSSWADFWDVKKFPGPRAYLADVTFSLEFALLADGVTPDKLYPIDVDRAFRKLNELKPHIKVFWSQGDQPVQLVSQGEVFMSPAWNGRVTLANEKGLPIDMSWNQGASNLSYFYIVKGAPHPEESLNFIDFCSRAKPQAEMAMEIPYGPSNRKALDLIPLQQRKLLPTYPDNMKSLWMLNGEWLGKNYDRINDLWQKFMIS